MRDGQKIILNKEPKCFLRIMEANIFGLDGIGESDLVFSKKLF